MKLWVLGVLVVLVRVVFVLVRKAVRIKSVVESSVKGYLTHTY